jgi:hypothetical protein
MDLFEEQKFKDKMQELKDKWPEPPPYQSDKWWRYRADQSYYVALRDELKRRKRSTP